MNPTEAQLVQWHKAIAVAGSMVAGTLARRRMSPRLVQDIDALLAPVMADLKALSRSRVPLTLTKEERRAART